MQFLIMNESGHTPKSFAPEDQAKAEVLFKRLTGPNKRMLAFVPEADGKHRQVKSLDGLSPDAEVLFTPQLQAG